MSLQGISSLVQPVMYYKQDINNWRDTPNMADGDTNRQQSDNQRERERRGLTKQGWFATMPITYPELT